MLDVPPSYNPVKIYFGPQKSSSLYSHVIGRNVLVFCSPRQLNSPSYDRLRAQLSKKGLYIKEFTAFSSNPSLDELKHCCLLHRESLPDTLIAIGGGSALDFAKAYKSFLSSGLNTTEYINAVANERLVPSVNNIYSIALPTTSGTGSEVTPFATIWDTTLKKKLSLTSNTIFYDVAIVDPTLTESLPYEQVVICALDAFNQALESLWNKNLTPSSAVFTQTALRTGFHILPHLTPESLTPFIRNKLSLMSLAAGLAISHTRTALCHSISYPLTLHFGVPHGLACAFTMPEVCLSNIRHDETFVRHLYPEVSTLEGFYLAICSINKHHAVAQKVRGYIKSYSSLISLIPEMYNPKRAKNNINPNPDIADILYKSWNEPF